jgi:hypothetical protein
VEDYGVAYMPVAWTTPQHPRPLLVVAYNRMRLVDAMVAALPDLAFAQPILHTTRAPREGEVEGEQYYFTTTEQMKRAIEATEFIEAGKYKVCLLLRLRLAVHQRNDHYLCGRLCV